MSKQCDTEEADTPRADGRTDMAEQVNLLTGEVEPPQGIETMTSEQLSAWVRAERGLRRGEFGEIDHFGDLGLSGGDFGDR